MVAALADSQFELDGFLFGMGTPLVVRTLDPGTAEEINQDENDPVGDGVLPGRDRLGGQTWTFELTTNCRDQRSASAAARQLSGVWRRGKRLRPGETMTLRYRTRGGDTYRVVGRPRKFAGPNGDVLMVQGAGKIVCEFLLTMPLMFDDVEASLDLGLVTTPGAGLVWPITFPITFGAAAGSRQGIVDVGGEEPTPFRVEIHGPVTGRATSPFVSGNGWRVELPGLQVAYDETVVVDMAAHTVTKNGVSVTKYLSRASTLSARLMPGGQEIVFGATDPTNTSVARFFWRPAHSSI